MRRRILVVASLLFASACAEPSADDRRTVIVQALVDADQSLVASRPGFVAGKHAAMARDLYAFYRATLPLYARDWRMGVAPVLRSRFAVDSMLPLTLGDAHPENFGLLLGGDGSLAFEPNDFDSADRYPYLWDVNRMLVGLALAVRASNVEDPEARAVAVAAERTILRAAALAYADEITRIADGGARRRWMGSEGVPALEDLFRRGERDRDARAELDELTVVDGEGRRTFVRGPAMDDAENVRGPVPEFALDALPRALESYRRSLRDRPPAEYFDVLDAVRELGSGVASWPRLRVLVLVRGPSDEPEDDVVLELKELTDSPARGWIPPGVFFDELGDRVRIAAELLWTAPDAEPLWGVTSWLGFPVQVRRESEAEKTLRVRRLEDDAGTVEALKALAAVLGSVLAQLQANRTVGEEWAAPVIARRLRGQGVDFAEEQSDLAVEAADGVSIDWLFFRAAIAERGLLLGYRA
ncbi:MAG: DUF2252 family protein, partial [Myxococcales bacterium]|nr:DUF2252 family protein [Myxococcales bacterium]